MSKKTIGKIAVDLMQKTPDTRSPIELEREAHKDYVSNVFECEKRGKKELHGDFFVVVLTKKERLLQNIIRNYYGYRESCPTPDYDQTVYRYDSKKGELEFLWVVPSKDTCMLMKENALLVCEKERELLTYVLDFADGTLYKRMKKLNKEHDAPGSGLARTKSKYI